MIWPGPRGSNAVDFWQQDQAFFLCRIINVIRRRPLPLDAVFDSFARIFGFQLGSALQEVPHLFPHVGVHQETISFGSFPIEVRKWRKTCFLLFHC